MSDKDLFEQELSTEILYRGRIVTLHKDQVRLPNGETSYREYVSHVGGAAVLAIDDDDNVVLVRQYRYAYRRVLFEVPAGKLEEGESPAQTALRELEEETGYTAATLRSYGVFFPSPGYTNEHLYLFVATDLHRTAVHPDDDEFVDVYRYPFDTVLNMVRNNEICDAKSSYIVMRHAYERSTKQ